MSDRRFMDSRHVFSLFLMGTSLWVVNAVMVGETVVRAAVSVPLFS